MKKLEIQGHYAVLKHLWKSQKLEVTTRDGHGSYLGRIQLNPDSDSNFFIGPDPNPDPLGLKILDPNPNPFQHSSSYNEIFIKSLTFKV